MPLLSGRSVLSASATNSPAFSKKTMKYGAAHLQHLQEGQHQSYMEDSRDQIYDADESVEVVIPTDREPEASTPGTNTAQLR